MKTARALLCVAALAVLVPVTSFAYDGKINLTGTIQPTTCTVNSPDVSASLGTIPQSSFNGVGSHSPWGQDFTINLDCAGVTSKVTISLSDATNPGNTTNLLSLTPTSKATGVGIEIWAAGSSTIYQYGPDTTVPGATNQVTVTNGTGAASQPITLKFSPRYTQTAQIVTGGSANGAATYTLQYQ